MTAFLGAQGSLKSGSDEPSITTEVFDDPGFYSWECPAGVTEATIDGLGAGGKGLGSNKGNPGDGGGGGAWARVTLTTVPGLSYDGEIGESGGVSQDTTFNHGATTLLLAQGGLGGFNPGFALGCVGDEAENGGYGQQRDTAGGGGGSAAGPSGPGNIGHDNIGGAAVDDGGAGGAGGTAGNPGGAATGPGGGGGGAGGGSTGGMGGHGRIKISYVTP